MIRGEVVRLRSTPLGTPGHLHLSNGFDCDTLELPWHDNERGKSCIKADTYRGRVWWSPMLQRPVIRFEDKNGRKDVLVHNGNWAADTEDLDGDGIFEVTQVHGCTEVGMTYGDIERKDGKKQWGIKFSGSTLAELIKSLRNGEEAGQADKDGYLTGYFDVEITYRWAPGCEP